MAHNNVSSNGLLRSSGMCRLSCMNDVTSLSHSAVEVASSRVNQLRTYVRTWSSVNSRMWAVVNRLDDSGASSYPIRRAVTRTGTVGCRWAKPSTSATTRRRSSGRTISSSPSSTSTARPLRNRYSTASLGGLRLYGARLSFSR